MDRRILIVILFCWIFSLGLFTYHKVVCANGSVNPTYNTSAKGLTVNVGDTIRFSNLTKVEAGEITGIKWNFGDGQYSWDENPVHVYAEPNDYPVTLRVRGSFGYKEKCDTIRVLASSAPIQQNGSASILGASIVKQGISVRLNSSIDANSYSWTVQDDPQYVNDIQHGKSAIYTFSKPGKKRIVLTLDNKQTLSKEILVEEVTVVKQLPPSSRPPKPVKPVGSKNGGGIKPPEEPELPNGTIKRQ